MEKLKKKKGKINILLNELKKKKKKLLIVTTKGIEKEPVNEYVKLKEKKLHTHQIFQQFNEYVKHFSPISVFWLTKIIVILVS